MQNIAPRHIYVVNGTGEALYRFPLAKDGLPLETPDGRVALSFGAVAIAIGPTGETYVANVVDNTVSVFPPHFVSGTKPERVLHVTVGYLSWITVDSHGQLIAVIIGNFAVNTVVGYAAGAGGNAAPLWTLNFPKFTEITAITTDGRGRLILQLVEDNILVYPYALSSAAPFQIVSSVPSQGAEDGITIDAGELYFTTEVAWGVRRDLIAVGAVPANARGSVNVDRTVYADSCRGRVFSGFDPISYGIAVGGRWLFVSCLAGVPASATGVQVYDALRDGHQTPRLVLRTSELTNPAGLALGP